MRRELLRGDMLAAEAGVADPPRAHEINARSAVDDLSCRQTSTGCAEASLPAIAWQSLPVVQLAFRWARHALFWPLPVDLLRLVVVLRPRSFDLHLVVHGLHVFSLS